MGNSLGCQVGCQSQGPALLAAAANGDLETVRAITATYPDAGFYRTFRGNNTVLAVAAEGGDVELLKVIYEAAELARGSLEARHCLNSQAAKGHTPLMRACLRGHEECVAYMLSKGADVFLESSKGETCLHLAAKSSDMGTITHLLRSTVVNAASNPPATQLADVMLQAWGGPIKFADLRNAAGLTALHVATLKGSATAVHALLRHGASVDAGVMGSNYAPWLSRGSTALHIAAAKGFQACVTVILEFQAAIPGLDLRHVRNQQGLKPSTLARMAGHTALARVLSDVRPYVPYVSRARQRLEGTGRRSAKASSPQAVLAMLIQRAKLLLSLRAIALQLQEGKAPAVLDKDDKTAAWLADGDSDEKAGQVAKEVAEVADAWRRGHASAGSAASILNILAALDTGKSSEPAGDNSADEGDQSLSNTSSYAAAALVQAALNAMACSASTEPLDTSPTSLSPTTPVAAAVVVQAALRSLSGPRRPRVAPSPAEAGHSTADDADDTDTGPDRPRRPHRLLSAQSRARAAVVAVEAAATVLATEASIGVAAPAAAAAAGPPLPAAPAATPPPTTTSSRALTAAAAAPQRGTAQAAASGGPEPATRHPQPATSGGPSAPSMPSATTPSAAAQGSGAPSASRRNLAPGQASSGAPPAVRELVSHPLDPLNFTEAPLSASQSTYLRNVISRLRGRPHRRGAALSVPAPAAGTDTQRQRPTTAATAAATLQRTRSGRRNVLADALADRISSLRTTAMTLRSHEAPSPMAGAQREHRARPFDQPEPGSAAPQSSIATAAAVHAAPATAVPAGAPSVSAPGPATPAAAADNAQRRQRHAARRPQHGAAGSAAQRIGGRNLRWAIEMEQARRLRFYEKQHQRSRMLQRGSDVDDGDAAPQPPSTPGPSHPAVGDGQHHLAPGPRDLESDDDTAHVGSPRLRTSGSGQLAEGGESSDDEAWFEPEGSAASGSWRDPRAGFAGSSRGSLDTDLHSTRLYRHHSQDIDMRTDLHSVRLYRDHSNDYSLDLGGESEAPPRGLSRDVSNDYSLDLSPESELQSRPLSRDVSNDYSMDLETESKHQSLAAAARLVKQHAAAFGCEEASSSSSPDKHTEKASVLQPGLPSLLSFHQAELVTTLESLSEAESVPDAAYRTPKLQSPNKCPASAVSPRSAPGQPALASAPQPAASPSEAPAVASQALQAVSRQAMGAREPTPASNASAGDAAMVRPAPTCSKASEGLDGPTTAAAPSAASGAPAATPSATALMARASAEAMTAACQPIVASGHPGLSGRGTQNDGRAPERPSVRPVEQGAGLKRRPPVKAVLRSPVRASANAAAALRLPAHQGGKENSWPPGTQHAGQDTGSNLQTPTSRPSSKRAADVVLTRSPIKVPSHAAAAAAAESATGTDAGPSGAGAAAAASSMAAAEPAAASASAVRSVHPQAVQGAAPSLASTLALEKQPVRAAERQDTAQQASPSGIPRLEKQMAQVAEERDPALPASPSRIPRAMEKPEAQAAQAASPSRIPRAAEKPEAQAAQAADSVQLPSPSRIPKPTFASPSLAGSHRQGASAAADQQQQAESWRSQVFDSEGGTVAGSSVEVHPQRVAASLSKIPRPAAVAAAAPASPPAEHQQPSGSYTAIPAAVHATPGSPPAKHQLQPEPSALGICRPEAAAPASSVTPSLPHPQPHMASPSQAPQPAVPAAPSPVSPSKERQLQPAASPLKIPQPEASAAALTPASPAGQQQHASKTPASPSRIPRPDASAAAQPASPAQQQQRQQQDLASPSKIPRPSTLAAAAASPANEAPLSPVKVPAPASAMPESPPHKERQHCASVRPETDASSSGTDQCRAEPTNRRPDLLASGPSPHSQAPEQPRATATCTGSIAAPESRKMQAGAAPLAAPLAGKQVASHAWDLGSVSAEDVSSSRDLMATDLAATDLTATDLAESNARSAAGTDTDVLTTDEPEVLEGRSAFGPPALSVNTKGKNAVKEGERCAICMDRPLEVLIGGCDHQLCVRCAYQLCARGLSAPLCPYCRRSIAAFHPVCGQSSGGQELRT